MISLEGLCLVTGRFNTAGWILRTFSRYVRDGLIPNVFPEKEEFGVYNTADATLWMFHALDRYLEYTGDWTTVRLLLPQLYEIVEKHLAGTRFGIGIDPADNLLRQGQKGYALTWMDAKVGDLVVTPRRGKAVEINALWYNTLMLLQEWATRNGEVNRRQSLKSEAEKTRHSFNEKFWYIGGKYLYDVVDGEKGNDAACRPNQIFTISLKYPILEKERWQPVMDVIKTKLLTPYGLRTLAPEHPDYRRQYDGDILARDQAYHQGTVWPWLMGHYVDAFLRTFPDQQDKIQALLDPLLDHFNNTACVGSISEVFDAEEPFLPRGCIAQAWSVAEILRAWVKIRISNSPSSESEARIHSVLS